MTHFKSNRSQIDEIKEKISLENVVSRYVKLKPVGKNLFGLCPFHKEDTPSFSVNTDLNIYKCFGCGESGDVFSFLQKVESMEFIEVLDQLAREAGIKLNMTKRDSKKEQQYLKTKQAHKLAAEFYHYILTKHKTGEPGRLYITQRRMNPDIISKFQIGFSPQTSNKKSLLNFLHKKGFDHKDMVNMGLAVERYGEIVDKFSNRIMFPIFDTMGNVIGFSGRIIEKNSKRPKYLNTPETVIFSKRKNLFGLFQSKKAILKNKHVIIVEGQTDVMSSWQHGTENIVAPLGTSLTTEQLAKLTRFTQNISICFDKDTAGQIASKRAATLAYSKSFYVDAIEIPYGNDADETIQHDPSLWKKAIKDRQPAISFFIEKLESEIDLQSIKGKQMIIEIILPITSSISNPLIRDHHIKEVCLKTGIPPEIIKQYLEKKKWVQQSSTGKSTIGPVGQSIPVEAYLLSLLLQYPESMDWAIEKIHIQDITNEQIHDIIDKLIKKYRDNKDFSTTGFIKSLNSDPKEICENAAMRPIWTDDPNTEQITNEITVALTKLKESSIRKNISLLRSKLEKAETQNNSELSNELLNQISTKIKELEALSIQKL